MKKINKPKRSFSSFLGLTINPQLIDQQYYGGCGCISAAPSSCSAAGYVPGTFTYEDCVSDIQVTCVELGACR